MIDRSNYNIKITINNDIETLKTEYNMSCYQSTLLFLLIKWFRS
jgi:hypothetical protein